MKNTYLTRTFAWAIVAAIPLWFGSCKDDDNTGTVTPATIVGSWKLTAYSVNPAVDYLGIGSSNSDLLAYYKSESTGKYNAYASCLTSTTLTFTNTTATALPFLKCGLAGSDATVSDNNTYTFDGTNLTYKTSTGAQAALPTTLSNNTLTISSTISYDANKDGTRESYTSKMTLTRQ